MRDSSLPRFRAGAGGAAVDLMPVRGDAADAATIDTAASVVGGIGGAGALDLAMLLTESNDLIDADDAMSVPVRLMPS